MNEHLKRVAEKVKGFKKSWELKSTLLDQPWIMVNDMFDLQKMIFQSSGDLILSDSGKVEMGSWKYLEVDESLLIETDDVKLLCNIIFIDECVVLLKLDGTSHNFIALAHQQRLPNQDIVGYFQKLFYNNTSRNVQGSSKSNAKKYKLEDGRSILIKNARNVPEKKMRLNLGNKIQIEDKSIKKASYTLAKTGYQISVKDNTLVDIKKPKKYETKSGDIIYIFQSVVHGYRDGDNVYRDRNLTTYVPDGRYKLGFLNTVEVKNGRVI